MSHEDNKTENAIVVNGFVAITVKLDPSNEYTVSELEPLPPATARYLQSGLQLTS